MRAWLVLFGALACGWDAGPAAAQAPHELRFDPVVTVGLDVPLLSMYLAVEFGVDPPVSCDLCVPNAVDLSISESLGIVRGRDAVARVSDFGLYGSWAGGLMLAFVGGYLGAGGGGQSARRGAEDFLMVAEAGVGSALVTYLLKRTAARQRPASYFGKEYGRDRHESFFSGHASQSAAIAASTTAVSFLRGYPVRWGVFATGFALTTTVGTLRVLSLKHWARDVVVGWLVGIGIGVAMPLLLHPREGSGPSMSEQPAMLSLPLLYF